MVLDDGAVVLDDGAVLIFFYTRQVFLIVNIFI